MICFLVNIKYVAEENLMYVYCRERGTNKPVVFYYDYAPIFYVGYDPKDIGILQETVKHRKLREFRKLVNLDRFCAEENPTASGHIRNFQYYREESLHIAKLTFTNNKQMQEVRKQLMDKMQTFQTFGAKINQEIHFINENNLRASGWINIKQFERISGCSYRVALNQIEFMEGIIELPAVKIVCFDLETISSTPKFTDPQIPGDRIIQIGFVTGDGRKVLYNLGPLREMHNNYEVRVFNRYKSYDINELDMITTFFLEISAMDVDILTGHNIFGFDENFLYQRAERLSAAFGAEGTKVLWDEERASAIFGEEAKHFLEIRSRQAHKKLSRVNNKMLIRKTFTENKQEFGTGGGSKFSRGDQKSIVSYGTTHIDVMQVISKQYSYDSYALDYLSKKIIFVAIAKVEYDGEWVLLETREDNYFMQVGKYIQLQYSTDFESEESDKLTISEKIKTESCIRMRVHAPNIVKVKYQRICFVKNDIEYKQMNELYSAANIAEENPDKNIVADYCIQDCELTLELLRRFNIVNFGFEISKICSVPFDFVYSRGQGVRILSLIYRECLRENYLIPDIEFGADTNRTTATAKTPAPQLPPESDDEGAEPKKEKKAAPEGKKKETYTGAFVYDPIVGYYEPPVIVLDFESLYPNSMIDMNLSNEMCINFAYVRAERAEELRAAGLLNVILTDEGKTYMYVSQKSKRGIVPKILLRLLAERKEKKKLMEAEKDPVRKMVYNSQQEGLKIIANSMYGQTGSRVSLIGCFEIADSTTSYGRNNIRKGIDFIENALKQQILKFPNKHQLVADFCEKYDFNPKIVYGDTDSVFIDLAPAPFPGSPDTMLRSDLIEVFIQFGFLIQILIKQIYSSQLNLRYEKCLSNFFIFKKKRYVAWFFETDKNKKKIYSRGTVLVRRDNSELVKFVYKNLLRSVIESEIIHLNRALQTHEDTIKIFLDNINDVLAGKFEIKYFITTRKLNDHYANENRIAHKRLANRVEERSGLKFNAYDRIRFIHIFDPRVAFQKNALQGDKIELVEEVESKKLQIDYLHYIKNQLLKPCFQFFSLILSQERFEEFSEQCQALISVQTQAQTKQLHSMMLDIIDTFRTQDRQTRLEMVHYVAEFSRPKTCKDMSEKKIEQQMLAEKILATYSRSDNEESAANLFMREATVELLPRICPLLLRTLGYTFLCLLKNQRFVRINLDVMVSGIEMLLNIETKTQTQTRTEPEKYEHLLKCLLIFSQSSAKKNASPFDPDTVVKRKK